MKRIDAGTSGQAEGDPTVLAELDLPADWQELIEAHIGLHPLRPVQAKALVEGRMLETRRHMVVCAPTNSGKSLIGTLALVEALKAGRRALLLEPLRSLAQEKADELAELLPLLGTTADTTPRLRLSTGDYRLENEVFQAPPPEAGELIVATPERVDAILRNPEHQSWIDSIACVVIDEAHLVGNPRRGPTLELLIATLLAAPQPPRLVLLSATAGEPERLRDWLGPCDLIEEESRTPPLSVEVLELDQEEVVEEVLCAEISDLLTLEDTSALVFVYRRAAAVSLAAAFAVSLEQPVLAYHSGMSAATRGDVRARFLGGSCRCVVTTTALAMGVNLPATHVFVRDTTFFGHGPLGIDEILQAAGRAGRGQRSGHAAILIRPGDSWAALELADALRTRALPPLRSAFEALAQHSGDQDRTALASAQVVATCLSRAGEVGATATELRSLLRNTLAGPALEAFVTPALQLLEDPCRLLAYQDDNERHHLTTLGLRGTMAVLPIPYVAGLGQLMRDLLWLDSSDRFLGQWSPLDHLLVMSLLSDRLPRLRRFSEQLAEQVDGWHEGRAQSEKSVLFREWISGSAATSRAEELVGSVGIAETPRPGKPARNARKSAYVAMLGAIVLDERSRGVAIGDLERRWKLSNLDGIDESSRDTALWLLAGQARLCELRCYFHHLVEHCGAESERIRLVKKRLTRMRHQLFDLLEHLKYCSPLGPVMRGVRGMVKAKGTQTVGPGTIRRLEDGGITSLKDLAALDVDALVSLGVQKRFAKQIRAYVRRRLR